MKKAKKNYPKIHKACAINVLRPALEYVFISKDLVKATDAYILIHHETSEVFDIEFIQTLQKNSILIHRVHFAEMTRSGCEHHKREGNLIKYYYRNLYHFVPCDIDGKTMTYPDTVSVFPDEKDKTKIIEIGMNPRLLSKAAEALDFESSSIKCEFSGASKPIIVKIMIGNYPSAIALIMPIMMRN